MTVLDGRPARIAPSAHHGPARGRPERELHDRLERVWCVLPDRGDAGRPDLEALRGDGGAGDVADALSGHCLERLRDPAVRDRGEDTTYRDALVTLREMAAEAFAFERSRTEQRIAGCRIALDVLRAAPTPHHLVEEICAELVRHAGFRRAMLARREGGVWCPWTAAVGDDCPGGDAPPDLAAAGPDHSIASVIRAGDEELGLLCVDHGLGGGAIDALDREVFELFAEGVGRTFGRTAMLARLRLQRDHVLERLAEVDRDVGALTGAPVELSRVPDPCDDVAAPRTVPALMGDGDGEDASDEGDRLTGRQREILGLLVRGDTNAVIAEKLGITVGTTKSHVKRILRKLGAVNRSQAIAVCVEAGWEPPVRTPRNA